MNKEKFATYSLRLYVAGQTKNSVAALANLRRICEAHLAGEYSIEVIDLREHPRLAAGDQILAVPTLVRRLPGANPQDHRRPVQRRTRARGPGCATGGAVIS